MFNISFSLYDEKAAHSRNTSHFARALIETGNYIKKKRNNNHLIAIGRVLVYNHEGRKNIQSSPRERHNDSFAANNFRRIHRD